MDRFTTELRDEPEVDKGVRMLRVLREFVASPHGVTALTIDGHYVMLVKYDETRHLTVDADDTDLDL